MNDYREVLYANYSSNFGPLKQVDDKMRWSRYDQHYDVSGLSPDAKIADLGCGRGEWLAWLTSKGYTNLTGFDFTDEAASRQFPGVNYRHFQGDVLNCLSAHENEFNLLTCHDLIEHLTKMEVLDFVRACAKALKPGGQVWFSTFNAQSALSESVHYGDFTHETAFTPLSMYQMLAACGMEKISCRTVDSALATSLGGTLRVVSINLINAVLKWVFAAKKGRQRYPDGVEGNGVGGTLIAHASSPA